MTVRAAPILMGLCLVSDLLMSTSGAYLSIVAVQGKRRLPKRESRYRVVDVAQSA